MSKTEMPAAEVSSYELAFHVLPTVAEGEVATVFQNLKDIITKAGGELGIEEAPARFDLAYEIVKYLEGRNRKFSSAYFGWVRFTVAPAQIEEITEGVEGTKELLRHVLIKLTRVEEENPFYFHEALEASAKPETIELNEENATVEAKPEEKKEEAEVVEEKKEETEEKVEKTEESTDSEETSEEEKK